MKRSIAWILALLMLVPLFAACSENASNGDDETASSASPGVTAVEEAADVTEDVETKMLDDIPDDLKYGGADVRVAHMSGADKAKEIYVEEDTGDALVSAIYARNLKVEDRLDVKIVSVPADDTQTLLRRTAQSGSDDFELCAAFQYYAMGLATEGILRNWNEIPHVDTSKPWWAAQFTTACTIGGQRLYFITGDAALTMLKNMATMYVNNTIYTQYFGPVSDLYSVVLEGGWTFDKMSEYCVDVYTDLNGDGNRDGGDLYGYGTTTLSMLDYSVAGAGLRWCEYDENGYPVVSINNERTVSFVEKLYRLLYENIGSYIAAPSVEGEADLINKFKSDTLMFLPFRADISERLRDMESDYAIVPLPKYDENQEAYSTGVHDSVSVFCIPITNAENADLTGAFMETFASESYRNVTDVYFETLLKEKLARDEVTAEIFDIIKSGVYFDFVLLHSSSLSNIGHLIRTVISSGSPDFASAYKRQEKVVNKMLEKLIAAYQNVG
ncbi:MAG: hypothetical protein E7576_00840 [Ruminococcaceae bacterium]|nr:hypothetical protein [Oscillospiraceae bacterium]